MKLSICIPTYNRSKHLINCLNSIIKCKEFKDNNFELCISDNCSTDETEEIVKSSKLMPIIKYNKNENNIGHARNFLKVVSMADGDFVWLIGDDDLLLPHAIDSLYKIIDEHPKVDFFFVNSYHLGSEYLKEFPMPFDTLNLPNKMIPFSKWTVEGELPFLKLIDPKVSFDFLGGIFLSVFRRNNWMMNTDVLDQRALQDNRTFSHFDNTFPHIKIFAKAFSTSTAYFNAKPLNVCLSGAREWAPLYPLIQGVRLVEALNEYRNNGLPYCQYLYCKNYALNNFLPVIIHMLRNKNSSGYEYINIMNIIRDSCLFPNFYFSILKLIGRIIRKVLRNVNNFFKG
jgi:glycosyltransferase involved in cell wall biosynthesis